MRLRVGSGATMEFEQAPEVLRDADGESYLHLTLDGPWSDDKARSWARSGANSLGYDAGGTSVDFLPELPGLRSLHLVGRCPDDEIVEKCGDLERLLLRTDRETRIDLTGLSRLKEVEVEGRLPVRDLADMPALRKLVYAKWPDENLDAALASGVRRLALQGVRRLRTIVGGEGSPERSVVEELDLAYGRHAVDLSGLRSLSMLTSLSLQNLKLQELEALGDVASLQGLTLINCGDIDSLNFAARLTALRHVAVHGLTVISRDLSPLDHVEGSRYVQAKRGYNRRFDEAAAAQ